MTEDEMIAFISQNSGRVVLDHLADTPWSDRRKHAKAIMRLFKATIWVFHGDRDTKIKDDDAVVVAVLATATASELKAINLWQLPNDPPIDDVLRALQPDWIDAWVNDLIAESPHSIGRVAPVWENGLCPRPTSDAFILGYYARGHVHSSGKIEEDIFFAQDVWRFFDVEGGGEFSLAACDKYGGTWAKDLLAYAEQGKLDRGRLLDASLDALERDFGQFVASWYSRFHTSLRPTADEIAARAPRYIKLLSSAVPPTVSFAIKLVDAAAKHKTINPATLLDALEPALQARAKGTVTIALKLVANAAKHDPTLSSKAAKIATLALVTEDAGLQTKVLDLIAKLGAPDDAALHEALAEYVPLAAPSVQARMSEMAGGTQAPIADAPILRASNEAVAIEPVAHADQALALFLGVLENHRDPFDVEKAVDGLARFGASLRTDEKTLSPLGKRARQLSGNPGESAVRLAMAVTGCDLVDGTPDQTMWQELQQMSDRGNLQPGSFGHLLMQRNAEIVANVMAGHAVPMLSMPSDTSGCVSADDLVSRLNIYLQSGVPPGDTDLQLALLRLAHEGRQNAIQNIEGAAEAEQAVRYACGSDVEPGTNAALWAAAWASRQPAEPDARIAALFQPNLPDCGTPAEMIFKAWREDAKDGPYFWPRIDIPVTNVAATDPKAAIPAWFYPPAPRYAFGHSHCGHVFEDVAWVSLVRPGWQEPYFRQAIVSMMTDQKLSDHYCLGFLEAFFRPGVTVGPLGHTTLVYYLSSEDKSLTMLTVDAVVELALAGKLDVVMFADALRQLLLIDALPTRRWTSGLGAIAQAGAGDFSREVITHALDFAPDDTPRDMGGMLELLFELHISSNTVPDRPETLACLKGMPGGGKVAAFSRKLVKLATVA